MDDAVDRHLLVSFIDHAQAQSHGSQFPDQDHHSPDRISGAAAGLVDSLCDGPPSSHGTRNTPWPKKIGGGPIAST